MSNFTRRGFMGTTLLGLAGCGMPNLGGERINTDRRIPKVRTRVQTIIQTPELLAQVEQTRMSNSGEDITLAKQLLCGRAQCSDEELVAYVTEFQIANNLEAVGYIGSGTLEALYNRALEQGLSLSFNQRDRVRIAQDLERYRTTSDRGRRPLSVPNAFNNRKFFGGGDIRDFEAISDTYITSSLSYNIPLGDAPNTLYVEIINGKYALRMYDHLGNLYVACYVSPGTNVNRTPEQSMFTTNTAHLDHVSSSYPEDIEDAGAPMYAATHVVGGVWIHSSADTIDGRGHSHGCIRAGLLYARAIHDYVASGNTLSIVIGDLYA